MTTEHDGALAQDPIAWFLEVQRAAAQCETFDVARAALATASSTAEPSVRNVLVKLVDARGFVFFTNYESQKARDLEANPRAALCFHWHTTGDQVRIRGAVHRVEAAESDAYFATRPRISQLGAWASQQSRVIGDRAGLDAQFAATEARFPGDGAVPRPAHWGGYRVVPEQMEFWRDRQGRLHDRWLFTRTAEAWVCQRLQP